MKKFKKFIIPISLITLSALLAGCATKNTTAEYRDVQMATADNSYKSAGIAGSNLYGATDYYEEPMYEDYVGEYEEDYYDDYSDNGTGNTEEKVYENQNRKLVRTVTLEVETTTYNEFMDTLDKQIAKYGGYIEEENSHTGSQYSTYAVNKYATVKIRIPDKELDNFLSDVSGIGNITDKRTNTEDVTLTYVDTESKKEMYLAEQESLMALLEKAESVEDIVYLTERLTQVRANIESMESKLRVMDNQVDYATINLRVDEVQVLTPEVVEPKTPGQRMSEGFANSVSTVLNDIKEGFINFVIALPFIIRALIIIGVIVLIHVIIIKVIIKTVKKKNAKRAAKKAEENKKETEIKEEVKKENVEEREE